MASSLQVLCPNGRRQNVQINPNTKLLQILEEVCQRQGYVPPEDYTLVQGQSRKELDLSLSVRFSSLPNNAKLELIKSVATRTEQDVTIAVQLTSGERLQDSFKPSASLWDILLHMEDKDRSPEKHLKLTCVAENPSLHPVCIFMREEVIGESALKTTTLKNLGLTSGKAIIRLLHRPVEERVLREIENKIEKEKVKQQKLEEISTKKCELRQLEELQQQRRSGDSLAKEELSPMETSDFQDSLLYSLAESRTEVDQDTGLATPSDGADQSTHNTTSGVVTTTNPGNSCVDQHLMDQTDSIPTSPRSDPDGHVSPHEQSKAHRLSQNRVSAALSTTAAAHSSSEPEQVQVFTDFRFPESTRGMDLSAGRIDYSQSSQGRRATLENQGTDSRDRHRDFLVYRTEEPLSHPTDDTNSIPDEFFEVTQSDVRAMYRDLQNTVHQIENQPLMTRAMREAQIQAFYDQYDRVVIRVQFPDRLTLQALFTPREPVSALYSFVQEHLSDPGIKFYLYTAPPKKILKDKSSSLAVCRLAPAALVYCSSESQLEHLLKEETRRKLSSKLEAEVQVSRVLQGSVNTGSIQTSWTQGTRPTTSASSPAEPTSTTNSRQMYPGSSTSRQSSAPASAPKWMKLGKQ